jgi:hypothetical protein
MPYSDRDRQREAQRLSARRRRAVKRAGSGSTGSSLTAIAGGEDMPALTAEDIAARIVRALDRVERDAGALLPSDYARAVAALASVGLRCLETRELAERLRALERAVEDEDAA